MSDTSSTRKTFEQNLTTPVEGMQVISSSGELFNHVDEKLPMWSQDGDRSVREQVVFAAPFAQKPNIMLSSSGIDSSKAQNLRFNLSVDNVTEQGFEIVFNTWSDTKIARASVNWNAFGTQVRKR